MTDSCIHSNSHQTMMADREFRYVCFKIRENHLENLFRNKLADFLKIRLNIANSMFQSITSSFP